MTNRLEPIQFLITLLSWCCLSRADFRSNLALVSGRTLPEDGKLNFTELSNKYGHRSEEYDVITEDGYILTTFRIPGTKPPVLLFHGLLDSADTFVLRGCKSLAVTLANAGYEVWVGNNRGNKYARRHVSLNPDTDMKFWDYSFHEIGYYDLAATIDFIRLKTGHKSISVIGHSQGTTAQFVLASQKPEYNARIKISIDLAPGVFYNNPVFPISTFTSIGPIIDSLIPLNVQEILTDHEMFSNIFRFVCSKGMISYALCGYALIFPFAGFDTAGLESGFLSVVMGHFPAATSRKSMMHYDQVFLRKSFSQYDYGSKNIDIYGVPDPPEYNLTAVTMPTALIVGKNDHFVTLEDARHLKDVLPNVVFYDELEPDAWNHLDFVWGLQMAKHLFPTVLSVLEEYNSNGYRNLVTSGKENRWENLINSRSVDGPTHKHNSEKVVKDCVWRCEQSMSRFNRKSSRRLGITRYRWRSSRRMRQKK